MDGYDAYGSAELAEIYDALNEGRSDIGFWLALAAAAPPGPIVELACGTGRVLLPLAQAGYQVTGLDLSGHMLERCRGKLLLAAPEVRDRVRLLEADMTSFELGRAVGAIFCPLNGFHLLRTVEQQLACLERCHAHLHPSGMLVLDLFNPDPAPGKASAEPAADSEATAQVFDMGQGRRVRAWMSACEYNRPLQCNDCEMTYEIIEASGATRRLTETFPLRFLYRYELEHLLARCGFRMVALYGDYDRSPFADESLGMIVVALREAD